MNTCVKFNDSPILAYPVRTFPERSSHSLSVNLGGGGNDWLQVEPMADFDCKIQLPKGEGET